MTTLSLLFFNVRITGLSALARFFINISAQCVPLHTRGRFNPKDTLKELTRKKTKTQSWYNLYVEKVIEFKSYSTRGGEGYRLIFTMPQTSPLPPPLLLSCLLNALAHTVAAKNFE